MMLAHKSKMLAGKVACQDSSFIELREHVQKLCGTIDSIAFAELAPQNDFEADNELEQTVAAGMDLYQKHGWQLED